MSQQKKVQQRYSSRRQFLFDAGAFLALPPLLSILPTKLAAQIMSEKKVRSVLYTGQLGIDSGRFFPTSSQVAAATPVAGQISMKQMLLKDIPGQFSQVIDSRFQPLYPYMNVYQGLSHTSGSAAGHNIGPLAGYSKSTPNAGASIDYIISNSNSVYKADESIPHRSIRIGSDHDSSRFSFCVKNGVIQESGVIVGDISVFNQLFGSYTAEPNPQAINDLKNRKLIVDRVYADLKRLENNRRISSHDKQTLDRYITSVFDLQKSVQANIEGPAKCDVPSIALEAQVSGGGRFPQLDKYGIKSTKVLYQNYNKMIQIAFACDLTRVVFMFNNVWNDLPTPTTMDGSIHHECPSSEIAAERQQWGILRMAELATLLRDTPDPFNEGNILDNSSILCTNELGAWSESHSVTSMPALTFGKAGGFIKTGHYLNCTQTDTAKHYRGPYGRPYKQLLQTIMASMGVPKSEYTQFGYGSDFGQFVPDISFNGRFIPGVFSPYAGEQNDPLPFIT